MPCSTIPCGGVALGRVGAGRARCGAEHISFDLALPGRADPGELRDLLAAQPPGDPAVPVPGEPEAGRGYPRPPAAQEFTQLIVHVSTISAG